MMNDARRAYLDQQLRCEAANAELNRLALALLMEVIPEEVRYLQLGMDRTYGYFIDGFFSPDGWRLEIWTILEVMKVTREFISDVNLSLLLEEHPEVWKSISGALPRIDLLILRPVLGGAPVEWAVAHAESQR